MKPTTPIRVKPEVKKEIKRVRMIYVKKLYEEGKDTQNINKAMDDGISQGDFIEVLLNYWKDRETKQ